MFVPQSHACFFKEIVLPEDRVNRPKVAIPILNIQLKGDKSAREPVCPYIPETPWEISGLTLTLLFSLTAALFPSPLSYKASSFPCTSHLYPLPGASFLHYLPPYHISFLYSTHHDVNVSLFPIYLFKASLSLQHCSV